MHQDQQVHQALLEQLDQEVNVFQMYIYVYFEFSSSRLPCSQDKKSANFKVLSKSIQI